MRLSELIAELEGVAQAHPDSDPEVRLAIQPSWPLQHTIEGVYEAQDGDGELAPDPQDYEDEAEYDEAYAEWEAEQDPDGEPVVYIAEGGQLYNAPYLPDAAAQAIGWGRDYAGHYAGDRDELVSPDLMAALYRTRRPKL